MRQIYRKKGSFTTAILIDITTGHINVAKVCVCIARASIACDLYIYRTHRIKKKSFHFLLDA